MVLCLGEKFWKLNHSSTEILIVIVAQKSQLSCSSFKGMTPMTQSPHTLSMASMGVCDTVLYKTSLEIEVKLKDDSLNRLPLFNSQCQWQKEIRGLSRTYSFIHFISIKYGTRDINFPRFRSDNIKFLHPKSTWTFRTFFTGSQHWKHKNENFWVANTCWIVLLSGTNNFANVSSSCWAIIISRIINYSEQFFSLQNFAME